MPLEVTILSQAAAGLGGLRQVAAQTMPDVRVDVEFGGACVVFRDAQGVVAVLERPCQIEHTGDVQRCLDSPVPEAGSARVWTAGYVPFVRARQGLELMAAVGMAADGQVVVKGVPQ